MILVDTYNILHSPRAIRELPGEAGVGELAAIVAVSRFRRKRTILICDGGPPPGGLGPAAEPLAEFRFRVEGVEVLYAGPGRDADSLIETLIERDSAPNRLTVVSSDRRLIRAAGRRRARSMTTPDFIRTLIDDAGRAARAWRRPSFSTQVPLSAAQTRYWAEVLGVPLGEPSSDQDPSESRQHTKPARSASNQKASSKPASKPSRAAPQPEPPNEPGLAPPYLLDPLIRAALEEWRGRMTLDDLNMDQWIGDDSPPARD